MKVKVGNEAKVVNRCMWLGSNSFLQLLIVIVNGNAGIALTMLVLYVLGFRMRQCWDTENRQEQLRIHLE